MQMILFKMAQQYYLISADSVDEVIDAPSFTKVPLAPEWVEGLINLRGSVVTVIRLAKLIPIMEHAVGVVTIGEKVASVIQIDHMIF